MKVRAIPGFDQNAFDKYLKNTGWLFLARVGSLVIKILANVAVARYLDTTQFGILNYPLILSTFFTAIAALGLDGFVTRELLASPGKKDTLLGTAFRLRVVAGIAVIPLSCLAFVLFKGTSSNIPLIYVIIASGIGLAQSLNIIDSFFQSQVRGKLVMKAQVFGNIVSAALKFALILNGAPLFWFVLTLLFDAVLIALAYVIVYRRSGNSIAAWNYNGSTARYLLKHSWPLAFSALLVTIYMRIGQLMVEQFLGVSALGIYSSVINWSESWYFIPVAIVTSVFPAVMNARRDDPARYQRRLQDMYDLMVVISLSIALIMTFGSGLIYEFFYPDSYAEGANVLSIHIWAGLFVFLGSASGQYLIAEGYTRFALYRTAAGAVVNIVLGYFLIPAYGLTGAAISTLAAYFSATFFILVFKETRDQGIRMLKSLFLISLFQKIVAK